MKREKRENICQNERTTCRYVDFRKTEIISKFKTEVEWSWKTRFEREEIRPQNYVG